MKSYSAHLMTNCFTQTFAIHFAAFSCVQFQQHCYDNMLFKRREGVVCSVHSTIQENSLSLCGGDTELQNNSKKTRP